MKFYRFILSRKFLFVVNFFCVAIAIASLSISIKLGKSFYRTEEKVLTDKSEQGPAGENVGTNEQVDLDVAHKQNEQKTGGEQGEKKTDDVQNYNREYIKLLERESSRKLKKGNKSDEITNKSSSKRKQRDIRGSKVKTQEKKDKNRINDRVKNSESKKNHDGKKYRVQIASFDSKEKAKKFLSLHKAGKTFRVVQENEGVHIKYRIFTKENFKDKKDADQFGKQHFGKNFLIKEVHKKERKRK